LESVTRSGVGENTMNAALGRGKDGDHCLWSRHYVNVVIAGKHPALQWLTMDAPPGITPRASASGSKPAMTRIWPPMCHGLLW